MKHIIIYQPGRTLIDRQTLATLTKRSVHTIRLRCPVAEYKRGRALYDMEQCDALLRRIPTRAGSRLRPLRVKAS